jgi:hypothetical protein
MEKSGVQSWLKPEFFCQSISFFLAMKCQKQKDGGKAFQNYREHGGKGDSGKERERERERKKEK